MTYAAASLKTWQPGIAEYLAESTWNFEDHKTKISKIWVYQKHSPGKTYSPHAEGAKGKSSVAVEACHVGGIWKGAPAEVMPKGQPKQDNNDLNPISNLFKSARTTLDNDITSTYTNQAVGKSHSPLLAVAARPKDNEMTIRMVSATTCQCSKRNSNKLNNLSISMS